MQDPARWYRTWCGLLLVGGLGGATFPALALGVRIPNQDAEAIGRGNAFVATADNPSALYYNPAGITQLEGHHVQLGGLAYLGATVEYVSTNGLTRETEFAVIPVPQFQYVYSPRDSDWSVGLGVYSPFGLQIEWPQDTGFRTLALEGQLQYFTINPVVAWQPLPQLSVAVGPTFNHGSLLLRRGIGFLPGDEFEFEGDGFGYGFNAGVRWTPHEKWALGLSYRFGGTAEFDGHSEVRPAALVSPFPARISTRTELDLPQVIIAGVSFRPTPEWNIEVNVDWADWEVVDTLTLEGTVFGDVPLPLNWESSFFYEFGVTRSFANGYYLSAGYFFSESSTPDDQFTPLVPDPDIHVGSLGVGYRGAHWRWAIAAQLFASTAREVRGSQSTSPVGESADGDYTLFTPGVSASVGYRF